MSSFSDADITSLVDKNIHYPEQVWYALAVFLFVVGCFQWGSSLHSKLAGSRQHESDEEKVSNHVQQKFSLRRIPLALVNFYRVVAFRWTLEIGQTYTLNMAEIFVTLGYIALLFTYSYINTTSVEGQKLDIIYWTNRAATIASSQFPIITALGTKNNLVSLVTGISYDRVNYIHRMMARTCFVLLWAHGIGEVYGGDPFFQSSLSEAWLHMGITAMVSFSILIIVSLRPIRTEAYEVFFYTHFFGVLIFLLGGYYHTSGVHGSFWIWPSFVFWALDRFIRVVRLLVFNHSYFGFKSGSGTMDATTELLSENVVRLRLCRPPHFHWSPGQAAYLIMPSVSTLPFEAHPFTIASFDSSLLSTSSPEDQSSSKENNEIQVLGSSASFWKELVFLVNVHGGFTKNLKEVASRKGQVKVFVDGPYGPSPDLSCYDTSVLVAGGSGVSYTLPVFLNVIDRVRNGKSACRRVVFIWSIRGVAYVKWIEEALIKAVKLAPSSLAISIRIFITGPLSTEESELLDPAVSIPTDKKGAPEHIVSERDLSSSPSLLSIRGVKLDTGRPNLDVLLKEEVGNASGRMSVSVCGSEGIARAVRRTLRFPVSGPSNILNGGPSVTLHVEAFGYA